MSHCSEYRESLLLDVHGEMAPEVRREWDKHLEGCPDCRQERQRLLKLMTTIRDGAGRVEPSPEQSAAIRRSIRSSWSKESKNLDRGRPRFFGIGLPSLPAFAAAMVVVVSLGWFGLRELHVHVMIPGTTNGEGEERMISQDLDLLENMDFLENMDVIQELVQVVDHGDAT